jgi:hypothetical protein
VSDDTDSDGGPGAASVTTTLSLDAVFEVLANRRRRFALYTLSDAADDIVELQTLVEDVVTLEAALAGTAVTREGYLETGTDLYEWHLPVLGELGVVDCDPRHREIRYRPEPTLERWLSRVRAEELP